MNDPKMERGKREREEKYRNIGFIGNKYVFDS
jgi:hypothetical protein